MNKAVIRDSNVIFDGENTKGFCSECDIPDIQMATQEIKNLAMAGTMKVFEGFEAMEATFKFVAPESTIIKKFMNPLNSLSIQVRGQRDVYSSGSLTDQQSVKYFIKGNPIQNTNGNRKKGDSAERECKLSVTYIKEVQDGETLYELDIENNIFNVAGTDLLATYRENLGLDA